MEIEMPTEKITSLASHAEDARYWSPEQMAEEFLRKLKTGELGDVQKACITYTTVENEVGYFNAGTHNRLELIGMLAAISTLVSLTDAKKVL